MWICSAVLALTIGPAAWAQSAPAAEPGSAVRAASVVQADKRTGRLVRKLVVTPSPQAGPAANSGGAKQAVDPQALRKLADDAAGRHGVDPLLVESVIRVESNYNPLAVSPKGAEGLMQLIPSTARRFGVTNSFNVEENIEAGVKYLKYLLDMFGDDRLAVAAYNAGESAVTRYGDVPPYRETKDYVSKVGKALGTARRQAAPAAAEAPTPEENAPRPVEAYVDSEGRICMRSR